MQAEIRAFARRNGLAPTLVPKLESLFTSLQYAASSDASTVDQLVDDRTPVGLGPPRPAPAPAVLRIAGRYEDLGPIGIGGMGEVRRVRDVQLNRTLAMKTLHARLLTRPSVLSRFLDEAQATAQLQHPNIVPVHDIGTLPDGRLWFTMKEVRGRTFSAVVREVHDASAQQWEAGTQGWTFRRLVNAYLSVCRAVAYAHERGVVHRDLKPNNVMVGEFGEVYVLDWGLAKIVGRPDVAAAEGKLDVVETARGSSEEHRTEVGRVVGTPAYMPVEQARGEIDRIDARSDVYALGALLYEVLVGRAPYEGGTASEVLEQVREGAPVPVAQMVTRVLPPELVAACERAMARDPDARFQTAQELAAEIEAWLDGARRREQALALAEEALAGEREAASLVARADALRAESEALLEGVERWRPEEDKWPGWARAKEAEDAQRAAFLHQLEVEQGLHAALQVAPTLPEAHAALAERYRARHAEAEAARDREAVARAALRVVSHSTALPEGHPTRRACAIYLTGNGALSLVTDPPGAEVLLHRYVERHRRLVPVFERSLGRTPLRAVSLPMGSYLCVLKAEGRSEVRYPIEVPRLGHWDGVRPGDRDPHPVWLPPEGRFGPDDLYVPAGWFRSGGDPEVFYGHPARRWWCDAVVMKRFPVTNREFIAFLDDLVAQGREGEALLHVPRERAGKEGELGAMLYGRTATGAFELQIDGDGDQWHPDWPVMHLDWHGARAYLAWLADRTGRPWRLPSELEWEKAARGVDGRWFAWGDHLDPSWCCMRYSHEGRPLPAVVDSYPLDESPFGVRGMSGNTRDWCAGLLNDEHGAGPVVDGIVVSPPRPVDPTSPAPRASRGGAWSFDARRCRAAYRFAYPPMVRDPHIGLRGCFTPGEGSPRR